MGLVNRLKEVTVTVILGMFCSFGVSLHAWGQENEFAIALDSTDFNFISQGFSTTSEDFTKGGSSLRSGLGNEYDYFVRATNIPTRDITIFWDYKIMPGAGVAQQKVRGGGETRILEEYFGSDTTEGWQTARAYLPPQITYFQLNFQTFDPTEGILIDNLRWARGDREFLTQGNKEPKSCNPDNPASDNILSRALDNTFFNFFTFGKEFRAQNLISNFGRDAVQNNPLTGVNDSAGIGTGIQASLPFTLTWDWKVSSHFNNSGFEFILFDENSEPTTTRITFKGEKDWRQATVTVPAGVHFPVWIYSRESSGPFSGRDTGWLDRVRIAHITDEPCITLAPIYPLILSK